MSKDVFQIKKENNELATKIIKLFLQNDNLSVDVTEYDAYIYFRGEEIFRSGIGLNNEKEFSFCVYSTHISSKTDYYIRKNYADFLEMSARMMRDDTMYVLNEILLSFVEKMKSECALKKGE